MSSPTPNFKAIIVGGSVAGLTLAHTLERARIPYVLLEARDTIAPHLGASIVIMPNGARVLDQLGVYEGLRRQVMTALRRSFVWSGDGRKVGENASPGVEFLRYMHDRLQDKSPIRLNKKVVSIEHGEDSVTVTCADGTEFEGDVVIGADGIHSRTRREMQKFAKETGPKGLMDQDENCITAQYTCVFGISSPFPSLNPGEGHVTSTLDHSNILFIGSNLLPQFFFVSKLPQPYIQTPSSSDHFFPRFTKEQMRGQLKQHADLQVTKTVTLGDLVENAKRIDGFPLEEATFQNWTYGRMVCVGDSVHKMTPNLGQGGNQAIESAVVLTNCLVDLLRATGAGKKVEKGALEGCLRRYQKLRIKRAEKFVRLSGQVTRNEALETLRHVLRFLFFTPMSGEFLADVQTEMYHTAPYLNFLPLPERTRDNEFWIEGLERIKNREDAPLPRL